MTLANEQQVRRIGVLGGTFDPIHFGHLIVAEEVRCRLNLWRVLFLPNREPPHKGAEAVTRHEDRAAMVRLAIASNPMFKLDLTEVERPGPSYALDTLRVLRDRYGSDVQLVFILGFDAVLELETWHEPHSLLNEFPLALMDRPLETDAASDERKAAWARLERRFPGMRERITEVEVPQIAISSSDVRLRIAGGRSIRYLVPLEVEDYIRERGLYTCR